jgi:LmbE family N-acetylglucosaminyl deacetylase
VPRGRPGNGDGVLTLHLQAGDRRPFTVLAVGSHPDDIEIGCGGTLLTLIDEYPDCEVYWLVLSGEGARAEEARRSAYDFLENVKKRTVVVSTFRDGFFPYTGREVKEFFEHLKIHVKPDIVLTHHRHDLHQDHRLVCELTWNTFRDHLILEYEIPKYDGDVGSPNVFVHLTESISRRKIDAVLAHFGSQLDKRWFTDDLFFSLLRIRGMESNSPTKYAEAFYCRKAVFELC